MNDKELLYKKLNCLRLEVDSSIVDDIKATVDDLFRQQTFGKPMLEEVLLDVAIEVQKQVCREADRLGLDDQQSDVMSENISMVFDNNKQKWIEKLMQGGK